MSEGSGSPIGPGQAGAEQTCPWCSARVPIGVSTCPACQAALGADESSDAIPLPGLTEVSPELRAYAERVRTGKPKRGLLSMLLSNSSPPAQADAVDPSEPDALRPPSGAVRAEMARIDAEIAAGVVRPAADPSALPARAPASLATESPPASPTPAAEPAPDAARPPTRRRRRRPPA